MQHREITRLNVEYRDGDAKGQGAVISMNWLSRHEGSASGHQVKLNELGIFSRQQIEELCRGFWNRAASRITLASCSQRSIFQEDKDCAASINEIRADSAQLVASIFDDVAIEIIWELARECRILAIQTNLMLVPWETLVNPILRNGQFLCQLCVVSRIYMSPEREAVFLPEQTSKHQTASYVDAELDSSWKKGKDRLSYLYHSTARYTTPQIFKDVRKLFEHMRDVRFINWICDNTFEKETKLDRLRLAEDIFCTPRTLMTDMLSSSSVVLLLTCGQFNIASASADKAGASEPIAALLACRSGCTVVCPLVPIDQLLGLRLMRLSLYHNSSEWSALSLSESGSIQVADIFEHFNNQGMFGSSSLFGMAILFFGIYGRATAELW
jgi:hypothetical protein